MSFSHPPADQNPLNNGPNHSLLLLWCLDSFDATSLVSKVVSKVLCLRPHCTDIRDGNGTDCLSLMQMRTGGPGDAV